MKRTGLSAIWFAVLLSLLTWIHSDIALAGEIITTRALSDDVEYRKINVDSPAGQVTVHIVLIKLDAVREGRLIVEPAAAGDWVGACGTPEGIARHNGALAAINGPYFASAGGKTYPLGFTALYGQIIQLGNLERPLVGIDHDGEFRIEVGHPQAFVTSDAYFEPIWLWGINAQCGPNVVTMYDRSWGTSVSAQGGTAVAVSPLGEERGNDVIVIGQDGRQADDWDGEVTSVASSGNITIPPGGYALVFRGQSSSALERYRVGTKTAVYAYQLPDGWESMRWIATLGPWFLHHGWERDYSNETSYSGNITGRSVRSAIGLTWNDQVFFAITRGPGLSIREAGNVLNECNAMDAIMCDSGSSSGMWVSGVGAIGSARSIPLGFIVREAGEDENESAGLRIWDGTLFRH